MFERRLKTLLIIISLMVLVLIGRAAQVQVIQRNYWKGEATKALKRAQYFPTSRGDIL
ncbi:MAG: hypothetical protein JWM97_3168, partial [Phycisphaerales bacterium]|nr:hypothetical protein [Phycisphaerales bacterium]